MPYRSVAVPISPMTCVATRKKRLMRVVVPPTTLPKNMIAALHPCR